MSLDYQLIVEAERIADGATIHRIKNYISNYTSAYKLKDEEMFKRVEQEFRSYISVLKAKRLEEWKAKHGYD